MLRQPQSQAAAEATAGDIAGGRPSGGTALAARLGVMRHQRGAGLGGKGGGEAGDERQDAENGNDEADGGSSPIAATSRPSVTAPIAYHAR